MDIQLRGGRDAKVFTKLVAGAGDIGMDGGVERLFRPKDGVWKDASFRDDPSMIRIEPSGRAHFPACLDVPRDAPTRP